MSLDLRLAVYEPNGGRRGDFPAPQEFTASYPLGDLGGLTLDVAAAAPRASWLADAVEVAVEVSTDGGDTWAEPEDSRFLRLKRSGDEVERPGVQSYDLPAWAWVLNKAVVLPEGLLNPDGKRPFLSVNVGTIMATLLQEAQARGALPGLTWPSWSPTRDSAGQPWDRTLTIYYSPGLTYWKVLSNLWEQGAVDWAFQGRELRLWNPDGARARDRAAAGVDLRQGRDLTEAPFTGTLEEVANFAYLQGDEGASLELTNPEAVAPWGRWETFISQGGVSDPGTMRALVGTTLERQARERVEQTYGLAFGKAKHLPFRDYRPGDYVLKAAGGTAVPLRVRQITLTRTSTRSVVGNVVLNDRFLEQDVRLARRLTGITGGATSDAGTGGTPRPPIVEGRKPAAPAGVVVTTTAYLDGAGQAQGQITAAWGAVTTDADGRAVTVQAYEVHGRPFSAVNGLTAWRLLAESTDTTASYSPLPPGEVWDFRVRAIAAGVTGDWSTTSRVTIARDATPPSRPSAPRLSVRLGVIQAEWDGRNDLGGGMPADFHHLDVALGDENTPGPTAVYGALFRPGTLLITQQPYNRLRHVRFRAVDGSGNASAWSAVSSIVVLPLQGVDLPPDVVQYEHLAAQSVHADTLISGLVLVSQIIAGNPDGLHSVMEPTGFKVQEGSRDLLRVGAYTSGDLLTVVDATGNALAGLTTGGNSTAQDAYVAGSLFYRGDELGGLLRAIPEGVVAYGVRETDTGWFSGERTVMTLNFPEGGLKANRLYAIDWSGVVAEPTGASSTIARIRVGTSVEAVESPTLAATVVGRSATAGDGLWTVPNVRGYYVPAADQRTGIVALTLQPQNVGQEYLRFRGTASGYPNSVTVTDLGPALADRGYAPQVGATAPGGSTPGGGATVGRLDARTVQTEFTPTWWANYLPSGARTTYGSGFMFQGLSTVAGRPDHSLAGFGNVIRDELVGAQVHRVEVYVDFPYWYLPAGGTARIGTHGLSTTAAPATATAHTFVVDAPNMPKPGGRWVDISQTGAAWQSGAVRGIVLGRWGSADRLYEGYSKPARVRITYTK